MAPNIFVNPNQASHIITHPDMPLQASPYPEEPSVDLMRLEEPCGDTGSYLELIGEATEPRPNGAAPFPNPNRLDNTVGPVPKISGYVFNTLQTNSATHVPNTNMKDTHICDLNLYETIFQNWCFIDELNSMTPDKKDFGVTPPNANTSSEAFPFSNNGENDPKNLSFIGSYLRELSEVKIEPPVSTCFTGSNPNISNERDLPSNKDCRNDSKIYNFTF